MTQDAVVTRVFENGQAEVAVTRGTACGGNCGNCESCMFDNKVKTVANNLIDARPGEQVIIESKSSMVYSAVALVYIMPLALFLIGYAISSAAGLSEGLCIASSFLGLVLGAVIMVLSQRLKKRKNSISFNIIQKK